MLTNTEFDESADIVEDTEEGTEEGTEFVSAFEEIPELRSADCVGDVDIS